MTMNVVVTGASSGIGYELVKKFIDDGHRVIGIARNRSRLLNLDKEVGTNQFSFLEFDLTEVDYQDVLIPFITAQFHDVDILVNNAGLLINKPISELSDDDFNQTFEVNVKSAFKMVRELLPFFSDYSHIVNISSMGGVQGSAKFPGLSLYSAAKAALAVLTECLAEEFSSQNIKVNSLALGAVQTEMLSKAFPAYKAPLKPAEMADFIAEFSLNGHRYFNGKILPVSLSTP